MIIENGIVKSKSPDINYYEDPDSQVYQIPLLKDYGIINKDLEIEDMRDNDIGKFLVIGLLLREL